MHARHNKEPTSPKIIKNMSTRPVLNAIEDDQSEVRHESKVDKNLNHACVHDLVGQKAGNKERKMSIPGQNYNYYCLFLA